MRFPARYSSPFCGRIWSVQDTFFPLEFARFLQSSILSRLSRCMSAAATRTCHARGSALRSEEHTSELQSLMRISYAVFCLKKKKTINVTYHTTHDKSHKKSKILHW